MSKTKDKRLARKVENLEFLIARRRTQIQMFEQALVIGEKIYEENKEKLSEEEITQLEELRSNNRGLLEGIIKEVEALEKELDEINQDPQA